MADYYPLLVRAISSLPQNSGESRRAVFDRARSALLKQLRSVDPPLPEGEITRERLSLEEAIRRVEADFAPQDNAPSEGGPAENAPEGPAPAAPAEAVTPEAPAPEGEPAAPQPETAEAGAGEAQGTEAAGAEVPSEPEARAERPKGEPAKGEPQGDRRPPLRRGEVRAREGAKGAPGTKGTPGGPAAKGAPKAPRPGLRPPEETGPSWKKLALWAAVAVVVLIGIGLAVVNRNVLFGGGETQTAATSGAPAEVDQPKSADRVATDEAAGRAPPSQGRPTAAGTERAILLEESPGGSSPPQSFEGTVTWKTETFDAGHSLPPETGVRGVITIPERQISMEFVLRRNTDQNLPASHTIQLAFKLPNDFAFGGIGDIPGVRVKPNQQAQGVPLAGLTVKVNPTLFLVGLSSVPADRQRNITLMQAYPWFDVPLVYDNNKRAVIQFDKGSTGDQVFNEAFSAWGELVERKPTPPPPPQEPPASGQ